VLDDPIMGDSFAALVALGAPGWGERARRTILARPRLDSATCVGEHPSAMRVTFALLALLVFVACEPTPAKPKHAQASRAGLAGAVIVASKNSDKFHRPSCEWAQKIAPDNLITFQSVEEAFRAGLKPCAQCKP
jgi:Metal binding domain of Ada